MRLTFAFRKYAIDSFELEAIDYLVKPFGPERFINTIGRIEKRLTNMPLRASVAAKPDHVFFKIDKRMVKVMLDEIIYIESLKD